MCNRRHPVIGLTGGIGSGKSLVAAAFRELGAEVIDSDALARDVMDEREVVEAIRAQWGVEVLTPEGKVDRRALRRVFDHPEERRRLEALIHPRVAQRREFLLERYLARDDVPAVVLDSPLLMEAGLDRACDVVIYVDAGQAERVDRVGTSRGWSEAELKLRENAQKPLDLKKKRADYTVRNHSTVDALHRQVAKIFSQLVADK